MNKSGPIIIIEDDMDDQEILVEGFKELNYNSDGTHNLYPPKSI